MVEVAAQEATGDAGRLKDSVRDYWDEASCGEVYAEGGTLAERLARACRARYALEPYIAAFADFASARGRDVLEIGVGMGCDHVAWAKVAPKSLAGIDLTPRAVEFTRANLAAGGLTSDVRTADAENLPFANESFDIVYSWGVLHHSPDTQKAVDEVLRVLRPGGTARIMIYHSWAITGLMLWARYGLLSGRPLRGLADIYARHLESPGTKGYSRAEAKRMFAGFSRVDVRVQLNHGDLLLGAVGRRHGGPLLSFAKAVWPRWLIRSAFPWLGLYLLITARK